MIYMRNITITTAKSATYLENVGLLQHGEDQDYRRRHEKGSGHRMARELDALIARRGRPATIVSDNGTEMTSRAMLEWTNRTGVDWHYPTFSK